MRIGIIGAGQLGQMLGFAARDLGVECRFLDPSDAPPAAACGKVIQRPGMPGQRDGRQVGGGKQDIVTSPRDLLTQGLDETARIPLGARNEHA